MIVRECQGRTDKAVPLPSTKGDSGDYTVNQEALDNAVKRAIAYQLAFQKADVGEVIVRVDRTIWEANPKMHSMFEYENLRGMSLDDLITEDKRHKHKKHFEGYLANPVPRSMKEGYQVEGLTRTGKIINFTVSLGEPTTVIDEIMVVGVLDFYGD